MVEENPALARKRRIEQRRACHRSNRTEDGDLSSSKRARMADTDEDDGSESDDHSCSRAVPSIRGIKRQARYEPGVPMTKEELQKWRKQARRVRNRESAAASRQKTRERITELEAEVSELQAELAKARARIAELEAAASRQSTLPSSVMSDANHGSAILTVSPQASRVSPVSSPASSPRSPPKSLLPPANFLLDSCAPSIPLPTMISRPTAV
ncbi:hypothetical protein ACA910_016778 [Epithemia clementina (nom. ined.)]